MSHIQIADLELHFDDHAAHDGAAAEPPLLLLHGFFGAASDWTPHLARLGGGRIVVPDLRGHGRSTGPAGAFSHREAADDVLALLDALGIERCRGVGLSGGANTFLHLATRAPERIESMVLVSATTHFPAAARAIQRDFSLEMLGPDEAARLRIRHVRGEPQIAALLAQARGFADSHDDLCFTAADLGRIRARTLVVSGDRDPLYPVEIGVELYRGIPDAALWVVPGGGHVPVEEGFFPRARAWLAGTRAAGG
jgi:pimeloyl-ACP methyl ester carboxylesterase